MKKQLDQLYTARWALSEAINHITSGGDTGTFEHLDLVSDIVAQVKGDIITKELLEGPLKNLPDLSEKKGHAAVALIVGHTKSAAGAVGADPIGVQEYHYWTSQMPIHQQAFKDLEIESKVFYRDGVGIAGAYKAAQEWLKVHDDKICVLIEYHFNAAKGPAFGTETLHSDKSDAKGVQEKRFAQIVQDQMVKCYGRTGKGNRGLKNLGNRGEAGFFNLVQIVNRPSVLIEPFFGDNPEEAVLAKNKEKELANALALAVQLFADESQVS